MGKMGGDELHQRINDLKERRRNDRINVILNAAANGDLAGLSEALKVSIHIQRFTPLLCLLVQLAERRRQCM